MNLGNVNRLEKDSYRIGPVTPRARPATVRLSYFLMFAEYFKLRTAIVPRNIDVIMLVENKCQGT